MNSLKSKLSSSFLASFTYPQKRKYLKIYFYWYLPQNMLVIYPKTERQKKQFTKHVPFYTLRWFEWMTSQYPNFFPGYPQGTPRRNVTLRCLRPISSSGRSGEIEIRIGNSTAGQVVFLLVTERIWKDLWALVYFLHLKWIRAAFKQHVRW